MSIKITTAVIINQNSKASKLRPIPLNLSRFIFMQMSYQYKIYTDFVSHKKPPHQAVLPFLKKVLTVCKCS